MKLIHISSTKCPDCGETQVIAESIERQEYAADRYAPKIRKHTNGQQWESRKFLCGKRVQWVPNFSEEQWKGDCQRSPAFREREEMQEKIAAQIKELEEQRTALRGW